MAGKKIVVLFDLAFNPPEDHDYRSFMKDDMWESERGVSQALEKLGHEVIHIGVHDDLFRLTRELRRIQPDLVFNLTEAFRNQRYLAAPLAGLLELLDIPYTGTKSFGLALCQDKGLSKKILAHHRIHVPKWVSSDHRKPLRSLKSFHYPAFVKPAREEASEGISLDSYVTNEKDCLHRVAFLHDRYKSDVIIEEFIPGREFYVSVLGAKRLQVLPIRELVFREFPEDVPRFATFKTKWSEEYRKKWGIRNEMAKNLPDTVVDQINHAVKKAFEVLCLSGFARFDLRLSENNQVVMLEANPNPSLSKWDDFAHSAAAAGIEYDDVIDKIISCSLN